eukprot:scaffold6158_cov85-Skeletonema_dohrnii-CCMP3373.AAC.3
MHASSSKREDAIVPEKCRYVNVAHEIFKNPRVHTGAGYYRRENDLSISLPNFSTKLRIGDRIHVMGYADATIKSTIIEYGHYNVNCLDNELHRIQAEKYKLQQMLLVFEEERERERKQKEEEEEARRVRAKRKAEDDAAAERAKQIKLEQDSKKVVSMGCGGSSTIILYENGTWACTAGLTKLLYNKLNGRQKSLPSPTYVSVGSQDRYYVHFADGKSEWVGCEAMSKDLKSSSRAVKTIAFGERWDSYFVVFTDGGYSFNNIPYVLSDLIQNKRKSKGDLECVSLGPNGEYFMSAKNGRSWWGGMNADDLARINTVQNDIVYMDFGDNGAYLARYT